MKIHMVSKGGLSKLHVCPHRGEGGAKIPKNPSTWFMDVPLLDSDVCDVCRRRRGGELDLVFQQVSKFLFIYRLFSSFGPFWQ